MNSIGKKEMNNVGNNRNNGPDSKINIKKGRQIRLKNDLKVSFIAVYRQPYFSEIAITENRL
jgi:hypothetical protein